MLAQDQAMMAKASLARGDTDAGTAASVVDPAVSAVEERLQAELKEVRSDIAEISAEVEAADVTGHARMMEHARAVEEMNSVWDELSAEKQKARQDIAALKHEVATANNQLGERTRDKAKAVRDRAEIDRELEAMRTAELRARDEANSEAAALAQLARKMVLPHHLGGGFSGIGEPPKELPPNLGPIATRIANSFSETLDAIDSTHIALDPRP